MIDMRGITKDGLFNGKASPCLFHGLWASFFVHNVVSGSIVVVLE